MRGTRTKIVLWTLGLALAGAVLGSQGSYAQTWQGLLRDSYLEILIGAGTGMILGYLFSRRLRKVSK